MLFLASGTGICVGGLTWLIKTYIFTENEETQEAIPIQEAKPLFTDVVGLPDTLIPSAELPASNVSIQPDAPVQDAPIPNAFQSNESLPVDEGETGDEALHGETGDEANEALHGETGDEDEALHGETGDEALNGETGDEANEALNGETGDEALNGETGDEDEALNAEQGDDANEALNGIDPSGPQPVTSGPQPIPSGPPGPSQPIPSGPQPVTSGPSGSDLSHGGGSRKLFISKIKSRKRVNKCKYCKNT